MRAFILIITLCLSLTFTPPVKASGWPVIDIQAIIQMIKDSVEDAKRWAQQKIMGKQKKKLDSSLAAAKIDNDNNIAANTIARLSGQSVENEKQNRRNDQKPLKGICSTIQKSDQAKKSGCIAAETTKAIEKLIEQSVNSKPRDAFQQKALTRQVTQNFIKNQKKAEAKLGKGALARTDLLTAAGKPTITPDEMEAATLMVQLIVGVEPLATTDPRSDKNTAAGRKSRIADKETVVYKNLVRDSFMEVLNEKLAEKDRPSHLQVLVDYGDSKFGGEEGEEWLKLIANVHPGKKDPDKRTNSAQVTRMIAEMQSFMVYMSVLQYRQQLRMEMLQAASLSLDIKADGN